MIRRSALIVGLLLIVALPGTPSAASRAARPSVPRQFGHAALLIRHIPRARFAKGTRAALLGQTVRAQQVIRSRRSCPAIAAVDRVRSTLRTPTTWKGRHVPRSLIRKPDRLLTGVENTLLRRAGPTCAKRSRTRVIVGRNIDPGPVVAPPKEDPDQGESDQKPLRHGPFRAPKTIGGSSGIAPSPFGGSAAGKRATRAADDPLQFFQTTDMGFPSAWGEEQEPTAAIGGNVVWYTGNIFDGLSIDNGRTFKYFSPSSVLPDAGLAFCCDQVVSYSPQSNLFVWVMQYWCNAPNTDCWGRDSAGSKVCATNGTSNRVRIAVATPQDLIRHAMSPHSVPWRSVWTSWDITPATLGLPANAWFDFSDLSVNPWNANWSVDVFCGGAVSAILGRISLADLSSRNSATIQWFTDKIGRMTTTQGLGTTTTYFAGNTSDSQARIWSWEPFTNLPVLHELNHSTVPGADTAWTGSDGKNSYFRYDIAPFAVGSSAVSGDTLYLAQGTGRKYCTTRCDLPNPKPVLAQPSIFVSRYDVDNWRRTGERWLWNPTYALGWPSLQVDGLGDVGIAFRAALPNHNSQPVAGFLTPNEQFRIALPEGLQLITGDYYSLRPGRTPSTFVMTGQTVQMDGTQATVHFGYLEYGHGSPPYVSPPKVSITAPKNLDSFLLGTPVTYKANVSDPVDGTLPSAAIEWSEDDIPFKRGPEVTHITPSVGPHKITVTATNGAGKSASASITVRTLPLPQPGAPTVAITAPPDGSHYCVNGSDHGGDYHDVAFEATATDPNMPPLPLSYQWTDVADNGNPVVVSTQLSPTLRMYLDAPFVVTTHDLTLTVSNPVTSTSKDIRVYIHVLDFCIK